jgi:hypothetical protein
MRHCPHPLSPRMGKTQTSPVDTHHDALYASIAPADRRARLDKEHLARFEGVLKALRHMQDRNAAAGTTLFLGPFPESVSARFAYESANNVALVHMLSRVAPFAMARQGKQVEIHPPRALTRFGRIRAVLQTEVDGSILSPQRSTLKPIGWRSDARGQVAHC